MRSPHRYAITVRNAIQGFTLLEIMIVLLLLAMILGMGIGTFGRVGSGPSIALGRIKEVVRYSRYHALREKAPSAVRIDPAYNSLVGLGWKTVGNWHFEDDKNGLSIGFPVEANLGKAELHDEGILGKCLDLPDPGEGRQPRVYIPASPSLNSVTGATIECFVYLNDYGVREILSKGSAYRLGINEEGRLTGRLRIRSFGDNSDEGGSDVILESSGYHLPIKRWVRVGLQFDGYAFQLTTDGILRSRESFKSRMCLVNHETSDIAVGGVEFRFNGRLDELRLSAAVLGDETPFHDAIQLLGDPLTIHFNSKGYLDPDYHTQPVTIEFLHFENRKYRVTVGLMGEVR